MDLEKKYFDIDGNPKSILEMSREEPEWTANRFQAMESEIVKLWADASVMGNSIRDANNRRISPIFQYAKQCEWCKAEAGEYQKLTHREDCPVTISKEYEGE